MASPPPPPPHGHQAGGQQPGGTPGGQGNGPGGGLPPGKYDIFVIPPHSAGSGFLYLPSLQPQRNSFLAGVACTVGVMVVWTAVFPTLKDVYMNLAAGGGIGMLAVCGGVGVAGWAWGKTQMEWNQRPQGPTGGNSGSGASGGAHTYGTGPPPGTAGPGPQPGPPPGPQPGPMPGSQQQYGAHSYGTGPQTPPPKPSWQRTKPAGNDSGTPKGAWEKAREEARKREEERKKAEELRKKAEELLKKREEEEKEKARSREKEARERREREAREKSQQASQSPPKRPPNPTARTEADEDAFSYRPYDKPKPAATARTAQTHSSSAYSEYSFAQSHSTRASTPPPSRRGPYSTKDPDKIVIKAVYAFNNAFNNLPVAQLVSGSGSVTDGLILRITTEGLFIDDDVRGVPQREWDVKAWTMKLVESGEFRSLHVLRATIRDQEGKRYVFILPETEGWKVAVGLQRLRRGTQVRALGVSGMAQTEVKAILGNMGFI